MITSGFAEAGKKLQPERRSLDDSGVVASEGFQSRLDFRGIKARSSNRPEP
jgi:hypothetical protein